MDGDAPRQARPRQNLNTEIPVPTSISTSNTVESSVAAVEALQGFITKTASSFVKGMEDGKEMGRELFGEHPKADGSLKTVEEFITTTASSVVRGLEDGKTLARKIFDVERPKGP
jgi:hypothetical protein